MTHPVKGIDHCFLLVNDLDQSAEAYRRLGFTLSPRGLHSRHKGTGNYTIMFPHDYLELLGIVHEAEGNIKQRQKLAKQGQGLHAIASRIENAQEAKKSLDKIGFATDSVNSFSRPITLPDGSKGVAAFDTLYYDEKEVPQGLLFMCEHKTPNMVWRPELMNHANGAVGLAAITAISSSPYQTAKGFSRLYADGHVTELNDVFVVVTGKKSATIRVMNEKTLQMRFSKYDLSHIPIKAYSCLTLYVKNIKATRQALTELCVDHIETEYNTITIAPEHCCGTILEFIEGEYLKV